MTTPPPSQPDATDGGRAPDGHGPAERLRAVILGADVRLTLLAVVTAVAIGAVVLALSDRPARRALGDGRLVDFLGSAGRAVGRAYGSLLQGALGGTTGISETLVAATVLILTGLAVTVPLRAGLFNIGGEGQVIAGGIVGGFIGFAVEGLPFVVHLPLAVLGATLAGALVGWLPGILKARTGAHEVISTIMLNNTLTAVLIWLLGTTTFQVPGRMDPISQNVLDSARLPRLSPDLRVDTGLAVAVLAAVVVKWLLDRSTTGFELNALGANPYAAAAAGMDPRRATVLAMATAGALGGLGGAALTLGLQGRLTPGFSAGLGFDGITVALLGRGTVGGTVAAGILLGGLKAGGRAMQAGSGTSLDLVVVIQALLIVFIAAPGLVRALFRVRIETRDTRITSGWGA